MKKILLGLAFSISLCTFSQQSAKDSLRHLWHDKSLTDSVRLEAMNRLTWNYYLFSQPDSAFVLSEEHFNYAKKCSNNFHMAEARITQATSLSIRGLYTEAILHYEEAAHYYELAGMKDGEANALVGTGNVYFSQGLYTEAINNYKKSLHVFIELNDERAIANGLMNIGSVYFMQGDHAQAIEYYTRSLLIFEKNHGRQGVGNCMTNIGNVYFKQKEFASATPFYRKGLAAFESIGDVTGMANALSNLGSVFLEMKQNDSALIYFNRNLELRHDMNDLDGKSGAYIQIGTVYATMASSSDSSEYRNITFSVASEYLNRGLEIGEQIENPHTVVTANIALGQIQMDLKIYDKAALHGEVALNIAMGLGETFEISRAADLLYQTYKFQGKLSQALEMHELFKIMEDSVESSAAKQEIIRQEFEYAYDKKQSMEQTRHKMELDKQQSIAQSDSDKQHLIIMYIGGGFVLVFVFSIFIYQRYRVTQRQKRIIELQHKEVHRQKENAERQKEYANLQRTLAENQRSLVELRNKEILDSITYAKRLQDAILPPLKIIKEYLTESFILYRPKDIVAGDFYWMECSISLNDSEASEAGTSVTTSGNDIVLFAAADCTGHGVPGALVSVVCSSALNRSVKEFGLKDPGQILDKTRELVVETFIKSESEVKDGMDISLCVLNIKTGKLYWSGANNPLWVVRHISKKIEEYVPDKQSIGSGENLRPFTTKTIQLKQNDALYIFTDGFADQFGGEKGKKYKSNRMKELILDIQDEPMDAQKDLINLQFDDWKGELEQVDDVCVIGVRIPVGKVTGLFSHRELEIIALLAKGMTSKEIADAIFISVHTVDTHRRKMLRKAGVRNSGELLSFVMRNELI